MCADDTIDSSEASKRDGKSGRKREPTDSNNSITVQRSPLSAATRAHVVLAGSSFSADLSSDDSTGWGDVFP